MARKLMARKLMDKKLMVECALLRQTDTCPASLCIPQTTLAGAALIAAGSRLRRDSLSEQELSDQSDVKRWSTR